MGTQASRDGEKVLDDHNSNGQLLVRVVSGWVLPSRRTLLALPSHINLHTSRGKGRCCHPLFFSSSGFKPVAYELRPHGPIPSAQGGRAEGDQRQARSLFYFHSPERDQPLNGKVWDTGDHKRVALPRLFYVPIVIAAACANWDVDTFRGWSLPLVEEQEGASLEGAQDAPCSSGS